MEAVILGCMEAHIIIPASPLSLHDLERFRGNPFDEMIKFVVDIEREIIALGGEMHADDEVVLLQHGSRQEFLWGGNLHPWEAAPRIEHTSLINIRPASANRSLVVEDAAVRGRIEKIVRRWVSVPW
jgi:hypothetical protein